MKKKELNELKNRTEKELSAELAKLEAEKLKLEVARSEGKEQNLRAVKNIRRDIAQILTIKNIIGTQEKSDKKEDPTSPKATLGAGKKGDAS
jgi:ribosomal protein L29